MSQFPSRLCCLLLLFLSASVANAATLGIDFTRGVIINSLSDGPRTNGFEFVLTETKTVTSLGFWDEESVGPLGLAEGHPVTLWDINANQLATVVVDDGSQVITSTQTDGRWRFEDLLSPVILTPGSYVIGAGFTGGPDPSRSNTTVTNPNSLLITPASFLSVTQGRNGSGGEGLMTFPGTPNSNIVLGPNPMFADDNSIPEPTSFALIGVAALSILARRRRCF